MEDTKSSGTSIEVLQAYLTAGIDCQHMGHKDIRLLPGSGKLIGLAPGFGLGSKDAVRLTVDSPIAMCEWFAPEAVLPVLYPFSALCEPLPDGTVPAVEVAKMACGLNLNFKVANQIHDGEFLCYEEGQLSTWQVKLCEWFSDRLTQGAMWDVRVSSLWHGQQKECASVRSNAILDYLRSQHFAVGLEPHQYVPKVGGLPTIEKKGPSA